MKHSEVDYGDVQGLVRFGYGKMVEASYALLRVRNPAAARAWLRAASVSSGVAMDPPPTTALQIAFTAYGLAQIGVPESVIAGFSPEFLTGMTEESRTRRLGDVDRNAPSQWSWGCGDTVPHLLVMFFAEPGGLTGFIQSCTGQAWSDAFEEMRWLKTADLDGVEPFGFTDGISQPQIDWDRQRDPTKPQIDYSNIVALGEFLLGYPNEYNKYTDRPLLEPDVTSADLLPAEDAPDKKDLARNGTYLVLRDLAQDVRGFWQFVRQATPDDAAAGEKLAAAMVGRTRAGDPLVPIQEEPIPGIGSKPDEARQNRFTYDSDPTGSACPFGAHVRRSNPRNPDFPGRPASLLKRLITMLGFGPKAFRDDLMSPVRFHRILRRGREYGPELLPEHALEPAPPNEPARGLHFICLNANISRQFEFLQNAWIVNTKFSGMTGESDPLLGTRTEVPACPVTADFNLPRDGRVRTRVSGLPQFVTVRGGAYFFLPSLRALRYFAAERS
ncbi:MAG: peroxidase [Spartobacteria bacterium]